MVAERLTYRCQPQLVEILQRVAATETDSTRRDWLERYARTVEAVSGNAPAPSSDSSPLIRRILELGPPGASFVHQLPPALSAPG